MVIEEGGNSGQGGGAASKLGEGRKRKTVRSVYRRNHSVFGADELTAERRNGRGLQGKGVLFCGKWATEARRSGEG